MNVSPEGQSGSGVLLLGNTSLTPYVAVVEVPGVVTTLGLQLRFALIGCAATAGTNIMPTKAISVEMTASFFGCIDFIEFREP